VELDDEHIDELQRATHGWPAGIRLALVQGLNPDQSWRFDVAPARLQAEFVLDPLAAELVDRLPADISDTLLAASIVEDLNPDLLDALVGQEVRTRQLIEEYTRAGVLISSAPRGGGWVRLHPLFRDLFRRQLTTRRSHGEIIQLHRNASRWFIAAGDLRSAVQHLLAARDIDDLICLLNTEIPLAIDQEDWGAVSEWLDEIPEEIVARSPVLALGHCWVLFFKGNWLAMRAARLKLRGLLEALPAEAPRKAEWLAELTILDATEIGSFLSEAPRLLATIETVAPDLAPNRRFVRGHVALQRAMALEELGRSDDADAVIAVAIGQSGTRIDSTVIRALVARCFVLRQRGDFARLETASAELAMIASTHNLPVSRGWAQLFYGFVLFQRNDLAQAETAFTELARDHARVHIACLREGMLLLARVYWALGDPTEAAAVIRRLREILAHQGSVEMLPSVASLERFLSYLSTPHHVTGADDRGDPDTILDMTPHAFHHPITTAILVMSESGEEGAARALHLAETFAKGVCAIHYPYWQPEILALQAIVLSALGREEEAVARMRHALAHPIARYLTRTFLDLGYRSHALYRVLADDDEVGPLARSLLSGQHRSSLNPELPAPDPASVGAPGSAGTRRRTLLSLLTDRELSVLELLEQRLSYKEIGNSLSISPLTVKRHAGNIYDKLGASSRREAVALAHELGWKPERDRP
jgi:LuxR family maltose regulon positive regulatory protein